MSDPLCGTDPLPACRCKGCSQCRAGWQHWPRSGWCPSPQLWWTEGIQIYPYLYWTHLSGVSCRTQDTVHQAWETLHTGSRAEHRSWDDLLEERTVALHSSSQVQRLCSRKKGTNSSLQWPETLSDTWIAKSENRLRKGFLMIAEHEESVGGQGKTEIYETNGEAGDEFHFMTIFCTNCTCKGRNRHQLYMGNNTTARTTVFWNEGKSIQKTFKNSWDRNPAQLKHKKSTATFSDRMVCPRETKGFRCLLYKRYTLFPRNSYRCYDMLTHKSNTSGTAKDAWFSWLRL